jgi:GAF domain-containing protein
MLRMRETKQFHQEVDVRDYVASNPADKDAAAFVKVSGVRTLICVPMLRDGEVVGAIVIYRQEVRAFNDREVELLKNFAAQAVIAIENARLLSELRQRTNDLTEALDQQTATSNVLSIISRSPRELDPVFNAILQDANRICEAKHGAFFLFGEGVFRPVASHGVAAWDWLSGATIDPVPGTALGQTLRTKTTVHVANASTDLDIPHDHPLREAVELNNVRTLLCVPMIKEDELIGAIGMFRQEVRPFTDKQIELVKNFAAQAVIAIENA